MRRHPRWSAALLVWGLAGCAGEAPVEEPYLLRDSAGIVLVENRGHAWEPGEAWLVDSEPVLTLGTLEGPEETQFFALAGAVFRGDGSVAVLDRGNARVSVFDAGGRFLWAQGREGEGPGEYLRPSTVLDLPGDSLLVYDFRTRRVTVVDPVGELARTYSPVPPEGASVNAPVSLVADGVLVSSAGVIFSSDDEGTDGRMERRPEQFLLTSTDGEFVDSLPALPGNEMWMVANDQYVSVMSIPFGKAARTAAGDGRVVMAVTERPEWRVRGVDGALERIIRVEVEPPEVTAEDWARAVDAQVPEGSEPDVRIEMVRNFEVIPPPDRWPVFADMLLDDSGHLWVERYPPPWDDTSPHSWWVFDPQGILLGEVAVPAGLEVDQVRGDRILGRTEDDLGIQRVEVYRVVGR